MRPNKGRTYAERGGEGGRSSQRLDGEFARKPLTVDEVWANMAPKNAALREAGHAELMREEVVGGRLYSGPMYEKYNAVLRAESGNSFMIDRCEVLTMGNRYATTIHAVTSCVLKPVSYTHLTLPTKA